MYVLVFVQYTPNIEVEEVCKFELCDLLKKISEWSVLRSPPLPPPPRLENCIEDYLLEVRFLCSQVYVAQTYVLV